MDRIRIAGGRRLSGRVSIGGAKNAALPALAASLLTDGSVRLSNLPAVADVRTMLRLLETLGASKSQQTATSVTVRVPSIPNPEAPYEMVRTMRASVLVLGPLLARCGRARVSLPGGCAIGARPVDMHLEGLRRMGARIEIEHGYVNATCEALRGAKIEFPGKTVTGTENLMAAACLARGRTVLRNCAREPEVSDMAGLLRAMGARIRGDGTDVIEIEGTDRLGDAEHAAIPDRIEAGTYIVAAAMAGDEVTVDRCEPSHLASVLKKVSEAGAKIEARARSVVVRAGRGGLRSCDLETSPYPGFPTDMQAQFMAMMTQAEGSASITEAIFESRFMHALELQRMGADVRVDGHTATVRGRTPLSGAEVTASDLRASACLVLAGLVASGETVVHRVYHLDRGYERIEEKLSGLGAAIERVKTPRG
jgi:UDP-N-acetylglucosamine 1-carboxyvinyltransferase